MNKFDTMFVIISSIVVGMALADVAQRSLPYPIQEPKYVDSGILFREAIPQEYHPVVDKIVAEYRFDYKTVFRLVHTESGWNPYALGRNSDGSEDRGLCQLNSRNSWDVDHWNPEENLRTGFKYLAHLRDRFGGLEAGLQAYNGGPGRYQRGQVPEQSKKYARKILAGDL